VVLGDVAFAKRFVVLSHGTIWGTVVRVLFFSSNYYHGKAVAYPMALFSGRSKCSRARFSSLR
jgi:hypothetical protein